MFPDRFCGRVSVIRIILSACLLSVALGTFIVPSRVEARRRSRVIRPGMPDDMDTLTDGEILKKNMDRYFSIKKPVYGSFVALKPATGEMIALIQYRRGGKNKGKIKNPAMTAAFPGASVFKIITAAALLEKGIEPKTRVCYSGGRSSITKWHLVDRKRERACTTFDSAFAHSTNAVFAKLADRNLTADSLIEMARRFGFAKTLNLGDVSTVSRIKRPCNRVGLARMAAGFQGASLSAVHGAVIASIIANDGKWPCGVSFFQERENKCLQVVSRKTAREIRKMMIEAVRRGTGTKYLARIKSSSGTTAAVKTGSLTSKDGSKIWNNWFVGFYPSDTPEIAFAVHIGHSWAGVKAGPAAKFALTTWQKIQDERKKTRAGKKNRTR